MEIGVISRKIKVRALSDALEKYCLLYMFTVYVLHTSGEQFNDHKPHLIFKIIFISYNYCQYIFILKKSFY